MKSNIASHNDLCRIISPFTNPLNTNRLKNQISESRVSWKRIIHLANTHLLIAAVWPSLCDKQLATVIEPPVREYLEEMHTLNLNRNQNLKRQAIEAIKALNKKGIIPLLLKGTAQLFRPIHTNFSTRMMSDLDILVPEDRIDEAIGTLINIKYQTYKKSNINFEVHHHAPPLVRAGEYACIELHRKALGNKIAELTLPTEEIWNESIECFYNGIEFKVPDPTHAIVVAILHSQVTHGYHQQLWLDYKALYDMIVMTSRNAWPQEWRQIHNRFLRQNLDRIIRTHIWVAHRLFNLPLPIEMAPNIYTRVYLGLYLAKIRWNFFYNYYDRCFAFYDVRLKNRIHKPKPSLSPKF